MKSDINAKLSDFLSHAMISKGENQVEKLFECLGVIKVIVESDILTDQAGDNSADFLKHILLTYDLPCSLKLCKILLKDDSSENSHRIKNMAQRALIIDPENPEAAQYLKQAQINLLRENPQAMKKIDLPLYKVRESSFVQP